MITWHSITNFIAEWYWIPMILVYAGVIITILSENRKASKSLAYILVIIFIPVVGLLIYYFVGRKPVFKKGVFDRKHIADREKMDQYYKQLKPRVEEQLDALEDHIGDMALPFRYLNHQQQSLISSGNKITLLNNGEEMFPALFKALQNARSYIHIEYYIFSSDDVGDQVAQILINKQKEGVEVRVIVDGVGSSNLKDLPQQLEEAGVQFVKILPVTFTSLAHSNYRDHRKIVVVDGEIGFVGGINIDDRYLNNGKHALYWRDAAISVEGPAVNLLQVQFFLSWDFAGGQNDDDNRTNYLKPNPPKKGDATVAIAASGPSSKAPYIMETILLAISQAKKTIRLCTPYFIPTDELTSALQIAAATGVEVELILPAESDSFFVQHAMFSFLKPLLERGVKVYLYEKGFMHSKTISIDSSLAFVGTVNLDIRSFYLNFEITAVIHEAAFCTACEASFEEDKKYSRMLTLQQWKNRPILQRGIDSVCRLMSALF